MADINLDYNYFDNIKSKRLRARLGELADVIPIRIWCYAAKHCPETGIFSNYTAEEIAYLCNYTGDAKIMLVALLEFGFLVKIDDKNFKINQWDEHQGHIIAFKERGKSNAKKRWDNYKSKKENATSIATSKTASYAPTYLPTIPTNNTTNVVLSKKFIPPTPEELKQYCAERKNNVDTNKFMDFYTSKGWMIGKNKMKDWKAAVRTWENNNEKENNGRSKLPANLTEKSFL